MHDFRLDVFSIMSYENVSVFITVYVILNKIYSIFDKTGPHHNLSANKYEWISYQIQGEHQEIIRSSNNAYCSVCSQKYIR